MTLPVVLNIAPHEKRQAAKLLHYIKELDGTDVRTFQFADPPGMRYPEVANWAFKKVAWEMHGQSFIWIEADSPPLVPGWAQKLTEEYVHFGTPYLYARQFNPPHDCFSGIGVHGPNAYDHVPDNLKVGGFDEHIVCNYPDLVGRTDLIRHSYGSYDANGDVTAHSFPRDIDIIGDKAVIFHKDQALSLIDHFMPHLSSYNVQNVSSVGDLGDCVVSLATLHHKGGHFDYYLRNNGATKGIVEREHLIRPFIEAQPYINAVRIWKREDIHWASEGFRPKWHTGSHSLAACHAKHALDMGFISTMPDFSVPWLTVPEPHCGYTGRVVINRSPRYRNNHFPWRAVVEHYGNRCVFIGMPEEHAEFCQSFGRVEYRRTRNMLEAAQIIAGSSLFIGNQSACMTIAEGLKHPRIQETCAHLPDCIYPHGPNPAQYVVRGEMMLPDVNDSGERFTPRVRMQEPSTVETPPGGWQYPGCVSMSHINAAIDVAAMSHKGVTRDELRQRIVDHNVQRVPEFFDRGHATSSMVRYRKAMEDAGL